MLREQTAVRQIVVYNYADRTAYGTANLTDQQGKAGTDE